MLKGEISAGEMCGTMALWLGTVRDSMGSEAEGSCGSGACEWHMPCCRPAQTPSIVLRGHKLYGRSCRCTSCVGRGLADFPSEWEAGHTPKHLQAGFLGWLEQSWALGPGSMATASTPTGGPLGRQGKHFQGASGLTACNVRTA